MALTEYEKKTARAYNIGYLLSTHEPRLLDTIIKRNPRNEFVKAMKVGRDHREFHVNVPRKDYTQEFKNGFYNGRTLAEHNPEFMQRLINSKGLKKDYINGLESAQKEHAIRSIQQKMDQEPKTPTKELRSDANFQKGFNVGYRLAENYGSALRHAENMNERYSKFIAGVRAGKEQYNYDLSALREKEPDGRLFSSDRGHSKYESAVVEGNLYVINEISNNKLWLIEHQKGFDDVPLPKWLQEKTPDKENNELKKDKSKDIDHDR